MNSKKDKAEFLQKMAMPPAGVQTNAETQSSLPTLAETRHQLRTPLNHIIGYSEMLIEDAEENHLEHFAADLRKIHAAGKQLLGEIEQLFGFKSEPIKPIGANVTRPTRGCARPTRTARAPVVEVATAVHGVPHH